MGAARGNKDCNALTNMISSTNHASARRLLRCRKVSRLSMHRPLTLLNAHAIGTPCACVPVCMPGLGGTPHALALYPYWYLLCACSVVADARSRGAVRASMCFQDYRTYAQAAAAGAAAVSETQSLDVTSQLCIICIPLHPTALFTDEREQCTRIERLCFCQCFSL